MVLFTVAGSSASLNCTVTAVPVDTLVALLAGVTDVTVGGVPVGYPMALFMSVWMED